MLDWAKVGNVAAAVGSLATAGAFVLMYLQLSGLQQTIDASTMAAIYQQSFNVTKHLADNPKLYGKYYDPDPEFESPEQELAFEATMELVADFYEFVVSQEDHMSADEWEYWSHFLVEDTRESPQLRNHLCTYQDDYSPALIALVGDGCAAASR